MAIHTKTGMLFGQHFDGEPPRNLNHVFLRQFGNGFNKKTGMFMFKNQNNGATLTREASATERHGNDRLSKKGRPYYKIKCKRPDRLSNQFGKIWYAFWLLPGQIFMTTGHFRQQKARLVEQRIQLFFFFR